MSSRDTDSPPAASREERTPPILGREKQRSRTGCRTCRSRKVKCDETPGGCKNCERLNLPCPNSPSYHSDIIRQQQGTVTAPSLPPGSHCPRRSRTYRSCRCCRVSKSRCSGERPVCLRCRQRGLECSYDGKEAPDWAEAISKDIQAGGGPSSGEGTYPDSMYSLTPPSLSTHSSSDAVERRGPTSHPQHDADYGLSWLTAQELPERENIALLVEEYFANIHNLRSFGFIHKPSFMQEVEDQSRTSLNTNMLLHIVCALGAKFYALKSLENGLGSDTPEEDIVMRAGTQWAQRAQDQLFADLNNVSVESAMVVVLLHDHELRIGNYASAFILTGIGVRMCQALQIHLETSPDVLCRSEDGLSPSERESRRRLAWAIYVMDAWAGQTLMEDHVMRIQLPCNEQNFVYEVPCVVQGLESGSYLPFLSPKTRSEGSSDELDLMAQFVRLVSLRRNVLRYVKHLGSLAGPWSASEYAVLEADLTHWKEQLPSSLQFERASIFLRKETCQLGGLLFLHLTYHQTFCDLTQIGMRDLIKTWGGSEFPLEHESFKKKMQDQCFRHAVSISSILDEALRHGPDALADNWLSVVAQDSCRAIAHYVSKDLGTTQKDGHFKQQATGCLFANLRALKKLQPLYAHGRPLFAAAASTIKKYGFDLPASLEVSPVSPVGSAETYLPVNPAAQGTLVGGSLPSVQQANRHSLQYTPDNALNPSAIFMPGPPGSENIQGHVTQGGIAGKNPLSVAGGATQASLQSGLAFDPIHASAASENQLLYAESMPIMDGMSNMELDDLSVPTSLDDLQTYIFLMVNNPSAATQSEFVTMQSDTNDLSGFGHAPTYSYPQPPMPGSSSLAGMPHQLPSVTEPPWPA